MKVNWYLVLWAPLLVPVLWIVAMSNAWYWVTMSYLDDVFGDPNAD
jgi:hypothetical protein